MKVYCVRYSDFAGKWIYDGYRSAWKKLGFDLYKHTEKTPIEISNPTEMWYESPIPSGPDLLSEDFIIMTTANLISWDDLNSVSKSNKTFLFVQPCTFPHPWGTHDNFTCTADRNVVNELDKMNNVHLWTFANVIPEYYSHWTKKIHTIPLAFDSINYKPQVRDKYKQFDISFVGSWADNGFNEKKKIIIDIFSKFKNSGLKCGFFINKNLTRQQECDLLANSKMTLNIHDAYQRVLGLDTNERTYKSLGLNGLMISDHVEQLKEIFPEVPTAIDAQKIVDIVKDHLSLDHAELKLLKDKNKQNILDNHCYTNRIEKLLSL